ncbi:MAG: cupin domain-containing protein [Chloroflexi bacterium]|nr:cupin domain-containing protein [Chloroflexota bacterium]
MPLTSRDAATPVEMLPGVFRRTMTDGERLMLIEVTMDRGAVVPLHTHPHEQTGYLISGRGRFRLGEETRDLSPGDCWLVPSGVPHEVTALERSVFIDVFSPPREDYR